MRYFVTIDDEEVTLELSEPHAGAALARLNTADGRSLDVDLVEHDTGFSVLIQHRVYEIVLDGGSPSLSVYLNGRHSRVSVESEQARAALRSVGAVGGATNEIVSSPMPGRVQKVLVRPGDAVKKGIAMLVIEAMKMENEIIADRSGTVTDVFVRAGDAVEAGARLVAVGP